MFMMYIWKKKIIIFSCWLEKKKNGSVKNFLCCIFLSIISDFYASIKVHYLLKKNCPSVQNVFFYAGGNPLHVYTLMADMYLHEDVLVVCHPCTGKWHTCPGTCALGKQEWHFFPGLWRWGSFLLFFFFVFLNLFFTFPFLIFSWFFKSFSMVVHLNLFPFLKNLMGTFVQCLNLHVTSKRYFKYLYFNP